jgi:hypothetical protein
MSHAQTLHSDVTGLMMYAKRVNKVCSPLDPLECVPTFLCVTRYPFPVEKSSKSHCCLHDLCPVPSCSHILTSIRPVSDLPNTVFAILLGWKRPCTFLEELHT